MCGPQQLDYDGRQNKTAKKHEAEQPHEIRDRSENEREIRTGKDRKNAKDAEDAKTGRTRQLGGPPGASITTKAGPHDCKTDRRSTRAGSGSSAALLLGPASFGRIGRGCAMQNSALVEALEGSVQHASISALSFCRSCRSSAGNRPFGCRAFGPPAISSARFVGTGRVAALAGIPRPVLDVQSTSRTQLCRVGHRKSRRSLACLFADPHLAADRLTGIRILDPRPRGRVRCAAIRTPELIAQDKLV